MSRILRSDEDCADCLCRVCARNACNDSQNPLHDRADCNCDCEIGVSKVVETTDDCKLFLPDVSDIMGSDGMSDIVDFTEYLPHKVSEVICVKCGYRWIAVRPEDSKLRDLECPNCTKQGYAIETGEVLK